MPIEFHPEAQAEFDDAFDWYANRSSDAALAFIVGVDRAVALIVDALNSFPTRSSTGTIETRLK